MHDLDAGHHDSENHFMIQMRGIVALIVKHFCACYGSMVPRVRKKLSLHSGHRLPICPCMQERKKNAEQSRLLSVGILNLCRPDCQRRFGRGTRFIAKNPRPLHCRRYKVIAQRRSRILIALNRWAFEPPGRWHGQSRAVIVAIRKSRSGT